MKIKVSTQQIQKQILSPVMQQSIEVLLLPLAELNTAIDQELQNNPLLEISPEDRDSSQNEHDASVMKEIEDLQQARNLNFGGNQAGDDLLEERPIIREASLEENLLRQLHIEISDPLEIKIGELIIGDLNEDGYLLLSVQEIADTLQIQDLQHIEKVLKTIQNFEPLGIASRNLPECLILQLKNKDCKNYDLTYSLIENHLEELGKKRFRSLAKRLNVPIETIKEAAKVISTLEPKPARNYRSIDQSIYIKPDVYVTKDDQDNYCIHLNKEGVSSLRVNPMYKKMLNNKNLMAEEKKYIREKMKNALYFIKSIQQRGRTIEKISYYILDKQKDFFERGHPALHPMTLKDVAAALERNESTISRAINNKYMDTPQGLIPLKFFFSQRISETNKEQNGGIASRSIKEELKELIAEEDRSSPLSDQALQNHFAKKGMKIARRTISKYRQSLRILPSHLRKQ